MLSYLKALKDACFLCVIWHLFHFVNKLLAVVGVSRLDLLLFFP